MKEKLSAFVLRSMVGKLLVLSCLLALASLRASAGNITFSGSGTSGTVAPGVSFSYDADGAEVEGDWGIPGVSAGTLGWPSGYGTATDFEITFNFPTSPAGVPPTAIDPAQIAIGNAAGCEGESTGGTTFCAGPYNSPWIADLISSNTIEFFASPGDALTPGDSFFVNIFFSGPDPSGASFCGSWSESETPEPSSLLLLGTGLLGLGPFVRKFAHI
jgi:PEP-CTERM motif